MISVSNQTSVALLILQTASGDQVGGLGNAAADAVTKLAAIATAASASKAASPATQTADKAPKADNKKEASALPLAASPAMFAFASNVVVATTLEPGSQAEWDAQVASALDRMQRAAYAVAKANGLHHAVDKITAEQAASIFQRDNQELNAEIAAHSSKAMIDQVASWRDGHQSNIVASNEWIDIYNSRILQDTYEGRAELGTALSGLGAGELTYTEDNGELRLKAFQMKSSDGKVLAEYTEDHKYRQYNRDGSVNRETDANMLLMYKPMFEMAACFNAQLRSDIELGTNKAMTTRYF